MPDERRQGLFAQRRARAEAERRAAHWEALRASPDISSTAVRRPLPPLASTPPPVNDYVAATPSSPGLTFGAAGLPVLSAVLAITTVSTALPVFGQSLSIPLAVLGFALTAASLWGAVYCIRSRQTRRRWPSVGVGIAAVLLLAFGLGATTQAVVDGEAQLAGSFGDVVYRQGQALLMDTDTVATNQRLLRLPPEQARALLSTFDAAITQDADIAARWNPATAGVVEPPALLIAYRRMNLAAAKQSEALAAQKQNLLSPDTQLAAAAAEAYAQVERLTGDGPEGIRVAVDQAYVEAGLTRGGGSQ